MVMGVVQCINHPPSSSLSLWCSPMPLTAEYWGRILCHTTPNKWCTSQKSYKLSTSTMPSIVRSVRRYCLTEKKTGSGNNYVGGILNCVLIIELRPINNSTSRPLTLFSRYFRTPIYCSIWMRERLQYKCIIFLIFRYFEIAISLFSNSFSAKSVQIKRFIKCTITACLSIRP